jgi:23S rRNA (cytosine1962-C5)-methyltransferase
MNPHATWPDIFAAWILYEDADLLVVDKPEGVPSQSADPERPDDLVTRLRAYLSNDSSESPGAYLGVHQRLDQDTSGVLVFARRREANASLAAQFEGRSVRKSYIACVRGWPRKRDHAVLRDAIERGDGQSMRVSKRRGSDARMAVTRVKVLDHRADRAMLAVELETGRTHQARLQLAHAGAPIAGDPLYGGSAAPRLMLHASAIELAHPATGKRMTFASPLPPDFDVWLSGGDLGEAVYDDDAALERALARAVGRRWGLGRSAPSSAFDGGATAPIAPPGPRATTAFRLVNEEGDGLPRLAVDVYGGWLVAQLHADPWADAARRERVLDRLGALGFDGVYLKLRPKQANLLTRDGGSLQRDIAPPDPVRGTPAPDEVAVLEEGMPLLVRLGDGLSTGLFLDQRSNRLRVRARAAGKSVANLFAYTCAFTVAAALGGARRTVSVDASAAALERGRANLAHAGVTSRGEHAFVVDDAFSWLKRAARRGERFDLIVLDPPSYSTTKRGRFVAEADYVHLAASALALLAPRGELLACTNHRRITRARFRRILFDAARAAKREVAQVKDLPPPSDHPVPAGGEAHLKSAWVTCS